MEPGWPFNNRPTPERLWAFWKDGELIECETNTHLLGQELRTFHRGNFTYSRVHPTRALVEVEAMERRNELLASGWAEMTVLGGYLTP